MKGVLKKNIPARQPSFALLFRGLAFVFLFLYPIALGSGGGHAGEAGAEAKKDVFQVLGREQSLAESYAAFLNGHGKEDFTKYGKGIKLYSEAKADFDGLIESMKSHLIKNEPFDDSKDFADALKSATDKRIAFSSFIVEEVMSGVGGGTKGLPKAALGGAKELISAITEAAKTFWQEYHKVKEDRRQELIGQLNALKWKNFHEIGRGAADQ